MGCQRAVYQIDNDVTVGNAYDDSRMTDDTYTGEGDGEGAVVRCVLSKGWVRKPQIGAEAVLPIYICKARVLAEVRQN
ncbi:hypothetical protein K440DRAFT_627909 [Wilcoxina mikolae CBS 423.85]|nr:hypothetical protein K440DRAFT_627909 [Wilcoxina mikolae CBS 423.85]